MESEINLKRISEQGNYIRWIFTLIKPYLGENILEVGAGTGAFTKLFIEKNKKVLPVDKRIYDVNNSNKKIRKFDITDNPRKLRSKFDTIVCINVLEHIRDDEKALKNMHSLLSRGGKLILIVPAVKWVYGPVDYANNHYRRYSKFELIKKIGGGGYKIRKYRYINFIGLLGWIYQNKILKSKTHRVADLRVFNKLCPILNGIELLVQLPIGLNLLIIAEK